uniref:Uncharacterized protein n=1 Tax=Knipowitschia caucasica TaxID=637954 RepID=A0AAV2JZD2_KNICA
MMRLNLLAPEGSGSDVVQQFNDTQPHSLQTGPHLCAQLQLNGDASRAEEFRVQEQSHLQGERVESRVIALAETEELWPGLPNLGVKQKALGNRKSRQKHRQKRE